MQNILNNMRSENDARARRLREDTQQAVERISQTLVRSTLSVFAAEDIRHEVIGMAQQADAQGIPLTELLGSDEKTFCESVIQSGEKRTLAERLAVSLPVVVKVITGMFLFRFLILQFPAQLPFALQDALILPWFVAYILYFSTYPKKRTVTILWWVIVIFWWIFGGPLFYYSTLGAAVVVVAANIASTLYRSRVYRQKALQYGWNAAD